MATAGCGEASRKIRGGRGRVKNRYQLQTECITNTHYKKIKVIMFLHALYTVGVCGGCKYNKKREIAIDILFTSILMLRNMDNLPS